MTGEMTPISSENFRKITNAPIESFKNRELYRQWKLKGPSAVSYAGNQTKSIPLMDAEQIKAAQMRQLGELEDAISSAKFYKYFYSTFFLGTLLVGSGLIVQAQRNKALRWYFLAAPALYLCSYMNYIKYEESRDDIAYLNRRKELRESFSK